MKNLVFNVTGLTENDRATWEKDNIKSIMAEYPGYNTWSQEKKTLFFKNSMFRNKFKDRDDYDYLVKTFTDIKDRDSLFNSLDSAGEISLENTQNYQDSYLNADTKINTSVEYRDRGGSDALWEDMNVFLNKNSKVYKDWAFSEYLFGGKTPEEQREIKEDFMKSYWANKEQYGDEMAQKLLLDKVQTTISENQPLIDKITRGYLGYLGTFAGALINGAGFTLALATTPMAWVLDYSTGAISKDLQSKYREFTGYNPDDERSDFTNLLVRAIDNPITRFGNKIIKNGTILSDPEDEKNYLEIIRTAEEINGGQFDYFASLNTFPELQQQAGFTAAAVVEGLLGSKIVREVGEAATKAAVKHYTKEQMESKAKKEITKKILEKSAKLQNIMERTAVPGYVGTLEGVVNALEAKDASLQSSKNMMERELNKIINQVFASKKREAEKFGSIGDGSINPLTGEFRSNIEQRLYEQSKQEVLNNMADKIAGAEKNAISVANTTMMFDFAIESTINGFVNKFLQAGMFGPTTKNAVKRSAVGKLFTPGDMIVDTSGRAAAKEISKWAMAGHAVKEVIGEGLEEYFQELNRETTVAGGEYSMYSYLQNKYHNEAQQGLADTISGSLKSAWTALGKSVASKESIRAAILGALSSAKGHVNVQAMLNAKEHFKGFSEKNFSGKAHQALTFLVRNPIAESIRADNAENVSRREAAEEMTKWLSTGDNLNKFNSLGGVVGFAAEMARSAENEDEFSFRNSALGKTISFMFMAEQMQGTKLYEEWMNLQSEILSASPNSQIAKEIEEAEQKSGSNRTLEQVKEDVKKTMNLMTEVRKITAELEKSLGESIPREVKETLIFGKLSYGDFKERGEKIESELSKNKNSLPEESDSGVSKKTQIAVANRSIRNTESIEKINREIEEETKIIKDLTEVEAELSKEKKKELKNRKKNLNSLIEKKEALEKAYKENVGEDYKESNIDIVLSAREIMELPAAERFKILHPDNRDKYSEKQQKVIEELVNTMTMQNADFMTKIEDSYRLEAAQHRFLNQYNEALANPKRLQDIHARILYSNAVQDKGKEFKKLNEITDYDEFVKALTDTYDSFGYNDTYAPAYNYVLNQTLKDNEFYKRYAKSKEKALAISKHLIQSGKFNDESGKVSSERQKLLFGMMDYLVSQNVDISNAEDVKNALYAQDEENNGTLIKFLEKANERRKAADLETLSLDGIVDIAETLIEAIKSEEANKALSERISPSTPEAVVIERPDPNPKDSSKENTKEEKNKDTKNEPKGYNNKHLTEVYKSIINSVDPSIRDYVTDIINSIDSAGQITNIAGLIHKIDNLISQKKGAEAALLKSIRDNLKSKYKSTGSDENTGNSSKIQSNIISLYYFSKNDKVLNNLLVNSWKVLDFLNNNKITGRTPIYFIKVTEGGNDYVVAAVKTDGGPINIDNASYQPIGAVPQRENNPNLNTLYEFSDRLDSTTGPKLLNDGKENIVTYVGNSGGIVTSTSKVNNKQEGDTQLKDVFDNTLKEANKNISIASDSNNIFEHTTNEVSIKQRFLDGLAVVISKGIKSLVYKHKNTSTKKGDYTSYILINNVHETKSNNTDMLLSEIFSKYNEDKDVSQCLESLDKFNSFTHEFIKAIKDIQNKSQEEVGEYCTEKLPKILSRYLYSSKGEYKVSIDFDTGTITISLGNEPIFTLKTKSGEEGKVVLEDEDIVKGMNKLFYPEGISSESISSAKDIGRANIAWNVPKDIENEKSKNRIAEIIGLRTKEGQQISVSGDKVLRMSVSRLDSTITSVNIEIPAKLRVTNVPNNPTIQEVDPNNSSTQPKDGDTAESNNGTIINTNTGRDNSGKSIENKGSTILSSIKEKVERMKEDSKKWVQNEDGVYTNPEHTSTRIGVTTFIHADEWESSEHKTKSALIKETIKNIATTLGNTVDKFLKDVISNNVDSNYNYPNASQGTWMVLKNEFNEWKLKKEAEGMTFIEEEIKVLGTLSLENNKNLDILGVLDLLAYDKDGNFHIYDYKTFANPNTFENSLEDYRKQLTMYAKLLEDCYNVHVASINIIGIKTDMNYNNVNSKNVFNIENDQLFANGIKQNVRFTFLQSNIRENLDRINITVSEQKLMEIINDKENKTGTNNVEGTEGSYKSDEDDVENVFENKELLNRSVETRIEDEDEGEIVVDSSHLLEALDTEEDLLVIDINAEDMGDSNDFDLDLSFEEEGIDLHKDTIFSVELSDTELIYNDLSEKQKDYLRARNISEEVFNSLPHTQRKDILDCV